VLHTLELKRVSAAYRHAPVLVDIDIQVGEGEIVGVVGRNGVGKTALLKSVMGLLPLSSGEISFEGKQIGEWSAHRRARLGIGYVPQGRHVFPNLSVAENLEMGRLTDASNRKDLGRRLRDFFPILEEKSRRPAGSLSGGQQQQLAIARALIGSPRLLVLDEPSEGIQPSILLQIADVLKVLNREIGLTVLFVEQNLDLITGLADRSYVLEKGEIIGKLDATETRDEAQLRTFLSI
jgi:urea ABC transporter ATP-binding protein UrtE